MDSKILESFSERLSKKIVDIEQAIFIKKAQDLISNPVLAGEKGKTYRYKESFLYNIDQKQKLNNIINALVDAKKYKNFKARVERYETLDFNLMSSYARDVSDRQIGKVDFLEDGTPPPTAEALLMFDIFNTLHCAERVIREFETDRVVSRETMMHVHELISKFNGVMDVS